jgi:long-chain fatty acid transport protein
MLLAARPGADAGEVLGVLPDSGESIGMVGGRLANLGDASTVRQSPANMLSIQNARGEPLDKGEVQLNFSAWYGDVKFTNRDGKSVQMDDPWKILASLYFVQPIVPGRVAVGLALTAPFGLDSYWPRQSILRHEIPYEATLVTYDINPVLAVKATDTLTLALGLNLMYSQVRFKQFYPWSQALERFQLPPARDGTFRFEGDGFGISAFGGLRWEMTPHQRISIVGRLPIRVKYSGGFSAGKMPDAFRSDFDPHSDFHSDATFPGSLAIGYGIDLTDRLSLGLDFQWTWNSSHDDFPTRIGKNQALLGTRKGFTFDWQDSADVGVGASYRLSDAWDVRAGYRFAEWAQRSEHHTPGIPGSDNHLFSVGLGWHSGHHRIDAAYSYSYFMDRDLANNENPAFNGHYDVSWHVMTLSYAFQF